MNAATRNTGYRHFARRGCAHRRTDHDVEGSRFTAIGAEHHPSLLDETQFLVNGNVPDMAALQVTGAASLGVELKKRGSKSEP